MKQIGNFLANVFSDMRKTLAFVVLIGLVQSFFTNIGYDEAYYWRFAQDLDWGYFDHPPLVALMIAIGSSILPGTLGVRLLTVLSSVLTFYITWLLIPEEDRRKQNALPYFLLLYLSFPLLNIYGFITTPDVPLLLFTALYLLVFQNFLKHQSVRNVLILGMVMAALIYSKYHGLLVILVTLLSQLKLLLNLRFYLAALVGMLLYLPHLLWQYDHDFVSFEYHLFYRSVEFSVNNVLTYLLNSFLVLNPLIFPLFLYAYFKRKNLIKRNSVYDVFIWFFLIFFGFTSFRGHVEPQWIVAAVLPIIVYFHGVVLADEGMRKRFISFGGITVMIVFIARIVIMLPLDLKGEFHGRDKNFYLELKEAAKGRNMVYVNSYTEASRYSFYTGDDCFSYNFISFRKNQFDLWNYHERLNGKPAFMVTNAGLDRLNKLDMSNGEQLRYALFDSIPIVNRLKVEILDYDKTLSHEGVLQVKFAVENPYPEAIHLKQSPHPLNWMIYFFRLNKERAKSTLFLDADTLVLPPNSKTIVNARFKVDFTPGDYTIGMQITFPPAFPVSVSNRDYPITLE